MKKINYLLFFALLAPNLSKAQTWAAYSPFADSLGVYDIELTNANTAWFLAFSPTKAKVARTIDGGATFNVSELPLQGLPYCSAITSVNASTAFVVGVQDWSNSVTLKTIDGGQTWQNANTPWDPASSFPDYIHAFSPDKICQIGDPQNGFFEIYNTGNGGLTWSRVPAASIPDILSGEFGYNNSGSFVGNHIWFGTNKGRVYHSDNAGTTWDVKQTPLDGIGGMSYSDENNGIVAGTYGFADSVTTKLFRTSDGGGTWNEITLPIAEVYHFYGVPEYLKGTSIIVAGIYTNPQLYGKNQTWISHNRGNTWSQVSDSEIIGWPVFNSSTNGWAGEWGPIVAADHTTRVYKYTGGPLVGLYSPNSLDAEVFISPNPASEMAQVKVQAPEPADFLLLLNDASGKLLKSISLKNTAGFTRDFELQGLPSGTYTITVSNEKGSLARKFLKN